MNDDSLGNGLETPVDELDLLWRISESLVSKGYLQEILHLIVSLTAQVMDTNICSLMLLDPQAQELQIAATQSLSPAYLTKGNIKVGESICGQVVKQGKAAIIEDVSRDPQYAFPDIAKREGLVTMVCVPMRVKDRMIGVINCYTKTKRDFGTREMRMLEVIANQAAVAIENTRLQDENVAVRRAMEEQKTIDLAKTYVMEQDGLKEAEAYRLLQKASRDSRQPMLDVARSIILVYNMRKDKKASA